MVANLISCLMMDPVFSQEVAEFVGTELAAVVGAKVLNVQMSSQQDHCRVPESLLNQVQAPEASWAVALLALLSVKKEN
jgi:hypothetical protein